MTTVLGGCGLKPSNRRYAKALEAYEAKEYETAADLFQEAIEKNPDKTEFYLDYGFILSITILYYSKSSICLFIISLNHINFFF